MPRQLAVLFLVGALGACGSTGGIGGSGAQFSSSLAPPDATRATRVGLEEYRIGPQDKLEVAVFQVPDLTRTVEVDGGGKIQLPLIGQMSAAGRTPGELSADIAAALRKDYLKDPQVMVTVAEAPSRSVTVDGAVRNPGVYPIAGETTLMQAVALAQGADPKYANLRKVAIFRTIDGQRQAALFDLAAIRDGKAEDPPVYGKDVIVVDESGAKSLLRDIAGAMPLFRIFSPW